MTASLDKLAAKASRAFGQGDYPKAKTLLRKLLKADASHLDGLYLLGTLYAEQVNYAEADKMLDRATTLHPRSVFFTLSATADRCSGWAIVKQQAVKLEVVRQWRIIAHWADQ